VSVSDAQQSMLKNLFTAIDARDTASFLQHLSDDASFRFGSAPAARGKDEIAAAVDAFFTSIAGLRHDVSLSIGSGDDLICEGEVTYTRHDGSTITLPFADVFNLDAGRIRNYKIYMDIGPLYADP